MNPFRWIIGFINIMIRSDDEKESTPDGPQTSALTQERAKVVDEKGDKTGFETIIRIVATGNNRLMVETEVINIASAFTQFAYPDFNRFGTTLRHDKKTLLKNYIYRYFRKPWWLKKMIFNTEELASLFHFPHIKYNPTPEIKWQNFKIVRAPNNLPKD